MSEQPTKGVPNLLVQITGDTALYEADSDMNVVLINWDRLADDDTTRGTLCEVWKEIWTLPEAMREGPLCDLIDMVEERFPIMAEFCPEWWDNDYAVPAGPPVPFDATAAILRMGPDAVDSMQDNALPTDRLADDLPARQAHDGPFEVKVRQAALEFLAADLNEAADNERSGTA